MVVYGVRSALIAYVFLHWLLTSPRKYSLSDTLTKTLAGLLWAFVLGITFLSVFHLSSDTQSLFEPVRYWYWFSGFIFLYRRSMSWAEWRLSSFWAFLLFLVLTWQIAFKTQARMLDLPDTPFAIDASYLMLAVYPWILVWKRKLTSFLVTPVLIVSVLASIKRGAIISLVAVLASSVFAAYLTRSRQRTCASFMKTIILIACCAVAVTVAFQYYGDLILRRFSPEAGLSNREDIYAKAIEQIYCASLSEMAFGRGALSTLRLEGWYAHNDWLQLVLDYGFVIAFLYLLINLCILAILIRHILHRSPFIASVAAGYFLFMVRAYTGGYVNYPEMIYFMSMLGGLGRITPCQEPALASRFQSWKSLAKGKTCVSDN